MSALARQNPLYYPDNPNFWTSCTDAGPPASFNPAGLLHDASRSSYYYSVSPGPWQIDPYDHLHTIHIDHEGEAVTMTLQLPSVINLPQMGRLYFFVVRESLNLDTLTFVSTDLASASFSRDVVNGSGFTKSFTLDGTLTVLVALGVKPQNSGQCHWYIAAFNPGAGSTSTLQPIQKFYFDDIQNLISVGVFVNNGYYAPVSSGLMPVIDIVPGMPLITMNNPVAGAFTVSQSGWYRISWNLALDSTSYTTVQVSRLRLVLWRGSIASGLATNPIAGWSQGDSIPGGAVARFVLDQEATSTVPTANFLKFGYTNTQSDFIAYPYFLGNLLPQGNNVYRVRESGLYRFTVNVAGTNVDGTPQELQVRVNDTPVIRGTVDNTNEATEVVGSITGLITLQTTDDFAVGIQSAALTPITTWTFKWSPGNLMFIEKVVPTTDEYAFTGTSLPAERAFNTSNQSVVAYLGNDQDFDSFHVISMKMVDSQDFSFQLDLEAPPPTDYNSLTFELLRPDDVGPPPPGPTLLALAAPEQQRSSSVVTPGPALTLADIEKVIAKAVEARLGGGNQSFSSSSSSSSVSSAAPAPSLPVSAAVAAAAAPPASASSSSSRQPNLMDLLRNPPDLSAAARKRSAPSSSQPPVSKKAKR